MGASQDSQSIENPLNESTSSLGDGVPPITPAPPPTPPKPPAPRPPTPAPPQNQTTSAAVPVATPGTRPNQPTAPQPQPQPIQQRPTPRQRPTTKPNGSAASTTTTATSESAARPRSRSLWQRLFGSRGHVPSAAGEHLAQQEEERRQAPSWMVSFIFHLLVLIILALIPLQNLTSGPLTLVFGEAGAESAGEFELQGLETAQPAELPEMNTAEPSENMVDPTEILKVIEMPNLDIQADTKIAEDVQVQDIPFGIRNGLTGRQGPLKDALLSKFGGSKETQDAVELGLAWLAKQQKSDGSWSLIGPYSDGGALENRTGATAMALNAFLGAGYTQLEGKYANNVKLGLKYLIRRQNSEGLFAKDEPERQYMYAQAIASIAVAEAYGMTDDEECRKAALLAVDFAQYAQGREKGWRYEPRTDSDLSVTGWYVMALETAKMAGLGVDEKKLADVSDFLDSVSFEDKTRYGYAEFERDPSLSMTAEGVLCRIYLGWKRSDPALLAAVIDDLLPNKPSLNADQYSVYFWYYATQVVHHVGGKYWDEWNEAMKATLPTMQEKNGKEAGSWDPNVDMFGASGGRLYVTCFNIYCLEVYYRHLALYDLK
ncbi:MAG: prenyltransferase/squalene oxidase repeat-containing protein [Planctomycetota bacterium]